jgi:hypothetical protein
MVMCPNDFGSFLKLQIQSEVECFRQFHFEVWKAKTPPTIRSGTETQLIYNFRVFQTGAQLTNLKPTQLPTKTSTITMNNIHSQAHTHKQQQQQQQQQ